MSKLTKLCNSIGMHNDYEFFQDEPYIWRWVRDGRGVAPSAWLVTKRGVRLSDAWHYQYSESFTYLSRGEGKEAFDGAVKYLRDKFNITEVARSPFGGYGDREYVEKKIKDIKKAAEAEGGR